MTWSQCAASNGGGPLQLQSARLVAAVAALGKKMILVFQDDGLMRVLDSVSEANREYEAIDVENGEYTFLDDRGYVLKPILRAPAKKQWLLFFTIYDTVPFTLEPTDEKRDDLIARLRSGEIPFDPRSSRLRTLDELRREAPQLFSA